MRILRSGCRTGGGDGPLFQWVSGPTVTMECLHENERFLTQYPAVCLLAFGIHKHAAVVQSQVSEQKDTAQQCLVLF